jgi:hypothetical protein
MLETNRRQILGTMIAGATGLAAGGAKTGVQALLKRGSSGAIYIHPWDITEEGVRPCFDLLGDRCGLNELFVAAIYHANTFLLPHNPRRMVRWDDGSAYFVPQHTRWREARIRPVIGECVDTVAYLHNIVDSARKRNWGILFFTVFHFSHSMARQYPECCQVDAMGERPRAYLCPANPDVRAHDLAVVAELMETYGGDGIRYESLGYGPWNFGFVLNKVDVLPSPRDQHLLSLCFCRSCCARARAEGLDAVGFRKEVRSHLYDSLPKRPQEWDMGEVNEDWCRNAFGGRLWKFSEVRFNVTTSLYWAVQEIVNRVGGALMPFGLSRERNIMDGFDHSKFYPHLKRVSLAPIGETRQAQRASLVDQVQKVPAWAEAEMTHVQLSYASQDALRDDVLLAREAGVRHHAFHYYGMSRRYQLDWIGHCREAWM